MSVSPQVSPVLQKLIDDGLFDRLPRTFATFFFDQIKDWNLLFPAEQSYFERLFTFIATSDPARIDALFVPLRNFEQQIGVNDKIWPKRTFTLEQVDFLYRNPRYPEWRTTISDIFGQIDPILERQIAQKGHSRLIVVLSPPELPMGPDRMWMRIRQHGHRVALDVDSADTYLHDLLCGGPDAESLVTTYARTKARNPFDTWIIEARNVIDHPEATRLSFVKLEPYRQKLMAEVTKTVASDRIPGPRQLATKLHDLHVDVPEGLIDPDPRMAEFARRNFLNGNGTLLLNNTFVEWSTVQALRRARPSVAIVGFGVRNKVKPFTGMLIFSNQEKISPIPTQLDVQGTYIDLEVFYQYIWQECEKYVEYRNNTAYLFVGEGLDEMLVIAPSDFPVKPSSAPRKLIDVNKGLREWVLS